MKNKKRLVLSLLCFAIISVFSTFFATNTIFAVEYTYDCDINGITAHFTYTLNEDNKIEDLKCTNKGELTGNITIPSLIDGKEVVSIGGYAFSGASNVTGVAIPDSIEEISYNAFENCTN